MTTTGAEQVFYRRQWLNEPGHHSHAHVISEVSATPPSAVYRGVVDAAFAVMDCNRVAELHFTLYSEARTANDLAKARRFRREVNDFVDALEKAHAELLERRAVVVDG